MEGVYQAIAESPMRRERIRWVNTVWEGGLHLAYAAALLGLLFLWPDWLPTGVTALFLSLVCFWDGRWHRIPNLITYPTMAVGVAYHTLTAGWGGMVESFSGLLLGGGLLFLIYLFKGMGAGDVKAMAALGAVWGASPIFNIFLITALLGGVASAGMLAVHGQMIETIKRYWLMGKIILWTRKFYYVEPPPIADRLRFPYGVVISCGVVLWYLLGNIV